MSETVAPHIEPHLQATEEFSADAFMEAGEKYLAEGSITEPESSAPEVTESGVEEQKAESEVEEQKVESTDIVPVLDPRVKPQFEQLLTEKRKIRAREEALKGKEEAATKYDELVQRLKEDPYAVVTEYGGDLQTWAMQVLEDNKPARAKQIDPEIQALREKIAQLENRDQEAKTAKQQEEEIAQQRAAIEKVRNDTREWVKASSEYNILEALGLTDEVYNVIEQYAVKTAELGQPQLLPPEQAAAHVVKHHAELIEARKQLLASHVGQPSSEPKSPASPAAPGASTLTNANAGGASPPGDAPLTEEQAMEMLVRAAFPD